MSVKNEEYERVCKQIETAMLVLAGTKITKSAEGKQSLIDQALSVLQTGPESDDIMDKPA